MQIVILVFMVNVVIDIIRQKLFGKPVMNFIDYVCRKLSSLKYYFKKI